MGHRLQNKSLNNQKKSLILDLIVDIEMWDNAYHKALLFEDENNLQVKQNLSLREKCLNTLFDYLQNNTHAFDLGIKYNNNISSENNRFNRAALATALSLIQNFEHHIKEQNDKNIILKLQKDIENQWFYIFDYLKVLGGENIIRAFKVKKETILTH